MGGHFGEYVDPQRLQFVRNLQILLGQTGDRGNLQPHPDRRMGSVIESAAVDDPRAFGGNDGVFGVMPEKGDVVNHIHLFQKRKNYKNFRMASIPFCATSSGGRNQYAGRNISRETGPS